jgi:hypothetical protein
MVQGVRDSERVVLQKTRDRPPEPFEVRMEAAGDTAVDVRTIDMPSGAIQQKCLMIDEVRLCE